MDNEFVDISTSFKLQLGYGIGHVLNDVCASLWFTYFLVFFHLVLEFSATQAGNLMLIGQVVDAISTPFVGYHSDRTDNSLSARYGKRKLWHLFGSACVLASFPFIFTECIGCSMTHKWAQMFYFAAFIMIFQIGWATVQISHLSLIPELSDDDHTRSHLTAVSGTNAAETARRINDVYGAGVVKESTLGFLVDVGSWRPKLIMKIKYYSYPSQSTSEIAGICRDTGFSNLVNFLQGNKYKYNMAVQTAFKEFIDSCPLWDFYKEINKLHMRWPKYGFTVFSNIFVYVITWIVLHFTGECDKQQVGPGDEWKFRHIVYVVVSVGVAASLIFHMSVKEKYLHWQQEEIHGNRNEDAHYGFLRKPLLYQVAGIYMSTRLVSNVSQVLIPLYLHRTLGLAARSLAVIPLAMYLGSLAAAGALRLIPKNFTHRINYFLGSLCALIGFIWIYFGSDDNYKVYFIYEIAVLIGFGGAVMLVTGLALTADLVGTTTEASAFVYGIMSFTDKLACGLAIAIVQTYADGAASTYYRYALSWVCGGATIVGFTLTMLLPKSISRARIADDVSINATAESISVADNV